MKLYTNKAMQNSRQYTFIQNYRYAKAENIKLNKKYIGNILEIDWKEVIVTFNENKINLPRVVTINLQDKIKVRCLMNRQLFLFHIIVKQGITWSCLDIMSWTGFSYSALYNSQVTSIGNFKVEMFIKFICHLIFVVEPYLA